MVTTTYQTFEDESDRPPETADGGSPSPWAAGYGTQTSDASDGRRRRRRGARSSNCAVAVGVVGLVAASAVLAIAVRASAPASSGPGVLLQRAERAPETRAGLSPPKRGRDLERDSEEDARSKTQGANATTLYVVDGNRLWRIAPEQPWSSPTAIASGLASPQDVAVSRGAAYVTNGDGLKRVALKTGAVETVARAAKPCAASFEEEDFDEPRNNFGAVAVDASERGVYFVARVACVSRGADDDENGNTNGAWGIFYVSEDSAAAEATHTKPELVFETSARPTSLAVDAGGVYWTADAGYDADVGYVVGSIQFGPFSRKAAKKTSYATLLDGLPSPRYLSRAVDPETDSLYLVCEKSDLREAQIVRVDVAKALASLDAVNAGRDATYDKSLFDSVVAKDRAGYPTSLVLGADRVLYFPDAAADSGLSIRAQPVDRDTGLPVGDLLDIVDPGIINDGGGGGAKTAPRGIAVWPPP